MLCLSAPEPEEASSTAVITPATTRTAAHHKTVARRARRRACRRLSALTLRRVALGPLPGGPALSRPLPGPLVVEPPALAPAFPLPRPPGRLPALARMPARL